MAQNDTLALITEEFSRALLLLEAAFSSIDAFQGFIFELGWISEKLPPPISDLIKPGGPISTIATTIEKVEEGTASGQDYSNLLQAIQQGIKDITALENATFDPQLGVDFAKEFPAQLIQYVVIEYLRRTHPKIAHFLRSFGIIVTTYHPESQGRPAYLHREISFSNLVGILHDPTTILKDIYNWGGSNFDSLSLFRNLQDFLTAVGLMPHIDEMDLATARSLENNVPVSGRPKRWRLNAPLFSTSDQNGLLEAGVRLLKLPQDGSHLPGLALLPYVEGKLGEKFSIASNLILSIQVAFDLEGGVIIKLRPQDDLEVATWTNDPSHLTEASGNAQVRLDYANEDGQPIIILGQDGGSRFEFVDVSGTAGLSLTTEKPTDVFVELNLQGAKIFIVPSQDDGFLSKVLPKDGFAIEFELLLGLSKVNGFYFHGSAGLEVTLPLNLSLFDVIVIDSVYLGVLVDFNPPSFDLAVATSVSVTLGPVYASIEEMGLKAEVTLPGKGGNLGPVNLELKFKPPKGVAVEVDASAVQGGGYLFFDPDHGQYGGVLMLSIEDTITLKAIALITTKMPDGSTGFSMLIIISAEFTPIQLGFGFTLEGVGGLAGINRTIVTEALQAGIKNHAVDHIMFPPDPLKHAKQIISDLSTFFPPAEGRYVFGPMVKLGYEIFVTAELGVLLEVPSPIVIVIMGQISVGLPVPEEAVVEIHLDVIGILDFGKKFFSLDASMHDSHILVFSMYGDMALRLTWGEKSNFAFSIGGLNPHYQPPPDFPILRRFTICLSTGDNPKLGLQAYMAITPNSFQTGAAAFLQVTMGSVEVDGHLGFDALFIFQPFSFIVDFSAGISLKLNGTELAAIHLEATLSGPSPWHAWGTASISLLFFSLSVHVDVTIGDKHDVALPTSDPTDDLVKALSDPRNWSGFLPTQAFAAVSLKAPEVKASQGDSTTPPPMVYLDPTGGMQVKQKVLPLDTTIDKVGETEPPADRNHFSITKLTLAGHELPLEKDIDLFAPGQYFKFSDNDKLSQPSFSPFNSGALVSADHVEHGDAQSIAFSYTTEVLDSEIESRSAALYQITYQQQQQFLGRSAAAQAPSRNGGGFQFLSTNRTQVTLIDVQDPTYVVANASDLSVRKDILPEPGSKVIAKLALSHYLDQHPEQAPDLELIESDQAGD